MHKLSLTPRGVMAMLILPLTQDEYLISEINYVYVAMFKVKNITLILSEKLCIERAGIMWLVKPIWSACKDYSYD